MRTTTSTSARFASRAFTWSQRDAIHTEMYAVAAALADALSDAAPEDVTDADVIVADVSVAIFAYVSVVVVGVANNWNVPSMLVLPVETVTV